MSDRWVVWNVAVAPCCGARGRVHVYPAALAAIACECGAWIETPSRDEHGALIASRRRG